MLIQTLHQLAPSVCQEKKKGKNMWHVTCDTWHVTHDKWHMTHVGAWTFSFGGKGLLKELITKLFVEQPWLHQVCELIWSWLKYSPINIKETISSLSASITETLQTTTSPFKAKNIFSLKEEEHMHSPQNIIFWNVSDIIVNEISPVIPVSPLVISVAVSLINRDEG